MRKFLVGDRIIVCFIVLVMLGSLFFWGRARAENSADDAPLSVDYNGLHSEFALLREVDRDRVIFDKNNRHDKKMFPASMTKVMTALLGVEMIEDLDEPIRIDLSHDDQMFLLEARRVWYDVGMEVSARGILYGILIHSGGDFSVALANHLGGNMEGFSKLMNERAREIGMRNTHFTNPVGLHDDNHYSTLEDLSLLLEYALQNEEFKHFFTAQTPTTAPSLNGVLQSTLLLADVQMPENLVLGGRTGFTWEAGRCLLSFTEIGGRTYILVTGGATEQPQPVQDAVNVFSQIAEASEVTEYLKN